MSAAPDRAAARRWPLLRRVVPPEAVLRAGSSLAHARQRLGLTPVPTVTAGVAGLASRWQVPPCDDEPVFVLSAGWRSGSTLVQRMLNASGEILVWGEPFSETNTVQRLAESLRPFAVRHGRFRGVVADPGTPVDLANDWTAALCPSPVDLVEGHRALLRRTYAEPAAALGRARWGLKEVVLDAEHAAYLRLLFPRARIVYLVRDPVDSWRSYRANLRSPWYLRWPEQRVTGPAAFGAMWARLVEGFVADAVATGTPLVRYEDLGEPATVQRLARAAGVCVDVEVARGERVGSSRGTDRFREQPPAWELRRLARAAGAAAGLAGYDISTAWR